ncbi:hypothetical protein [Brevibacillus sp. 179-C9.3 HS]|uniref:hypothetical protein n=1 Tax=unclassified Brevibacillus TaxID=2684853 RepID=UPI0039A13A80
MNNMINGIGEFTEIAIRFLQMVGIPVLAVLTLIGLLTLLTAGKNPRRKRTGYIITIVFGICMLMVAYAPLLSYQMELTTKTLNVQNPNVHQRVDSTGGLIGSNLFKGLQYASIPITVTTFYLGFGIRLNAAGNPQRKRLGIGLLLFSPLTLVVVFLMPTLILRL